MSQKPLRILWTAAVAVATACVVSCGSNRPVSMNSSPGTPATASHQVATGPMLGAWWDSDRKGLRAIYGVLGASQQGLPTYADGNFSGAAVCMRNNAALLTTSSGAIYLANLPQGRPAAIVNNGIPKATIVLSPTCASFLAYTPGSSTALLIQELLSVPKVSTVMLPKGTVAATVSDTGTILVDVGGTDGSAAIKVLAPGSAAAQRVAVLSRFGGMAFLPGVDSAVLADAAANTVLEASQLAGNLSLTQIAGVGDGVANPVAIATSADGRWVAVANGKGSSVLRLDLTGQTAPVHAACHCSPVELDPLAGNFAFRLTEPGSGTVWAFDGNGSAPRIVFLPAEQSSAAAQGARP
jgi:hypothetical protein